MKIYFIICGVPRCIELVIKNIEQCFAAHEIQFYLYLTKNYDSYEHEYSNKYDFNKIILNNKIHKIILENDIYNSDFRNSLNYMRKINNIVCGLRDEYDLYIIMRSDLIFTNIKFLDNILTDNLYFCKNDYNPYTNDIEYKINDNIIITKCLKSLSSLSSILKYSLTNNNYSDIIMYNYVKEKNINYEFANIEYKLILSICNIISIAGDSGSGKSTLVKYLQPLFGKNSVQIETDRYHKWERGDKNYEIYTHLNPYANHLEKMSNDIYNLKIGNDIYAIDYDHNTGKFTNPSKIETKKNVILCGLHTLYMDKMNDILDIKIFMDTDRELIKKWKIKRDVEERGYHIEKVIKQINNRENDYYQYIDIQKNNADFIIKFYENNGAIKCDFCIKNEKYIKKIFNLIYDRYENYIENHILIIKMKNSIEHLYTDLFNLADGFYGEIQYFMLLCM